MSACRKSGDEVGGTLLLFFRSELFVLAVQKTFLVLVFKKKKSVSKCVTIEICERKKLREKQEDT